ncbi:hypothetical protein, partial [Bacteroides sp. 1_1_14]|uniref:hypothetical protein n=1 Tax=Bacteroides sp. 1_1_14 TaxID=469585 RepID=UPI00240D4A09
SFWRICRPLLKVSSTDIRTGSVPGPLPGFRYLCTAWGEGLSFFTGVSLKVKTARIPMVDPREHHPPELPLFFAGILVPFVKNVIWNIVP